MLSLVVRQIKALWSKNILLSTKRHYRHVYFGALIPIRIMTFQLLRPVIRSPKFGECQHFLSLLLKLFFVRFAPELGPGVDHTANDLLATRHTDTLCACADQQVAVCASVCSFKTANFKTRALISQSIPFSNTKNKFKALLD